MPILFLTQPKTYIPITQFSPSPVIRLWAISFQAAPRNIPRCSPKVSSQPACSPFHTFAHPNNKSTWADRGGACWNNFLWRWRRGLQMAEDDFTAIRLDAAAFRCTSSPSNPRVMPCHLDESRSISHLKTTLLFRRVKQGKRGHKVLFFSTCIGLEQFLCFNKQVPFTLTLTSQLSRA